MKLSDSDLQTVETSVPWVRAFKEPPTDFNYESASDLDLARYGLPLRPSPELLPRRHLEWKKRILRRGTRIVPDLTLTDVYHGPIKVLSQTKSGLFSVSANSPNWSGIAIVDDTNPFKGWGSQVVADWIVPRATCTTSPGGSYYSFHWVGVDGYGSNDVLQAGTEADINCPGSDSSNYAWIEWFPYPSVRINNLSISPGDQVIVSVSPSPIAGKGSVSVENQTTYKTAAFQLDPPPGVSLVGNCVEWVVERPGINGVLSNLANYVSLTMTSCIALHYATPQGPISVYYPGNAASGTIYDISMVGSDNNVLSTANVVSIDPSLPNAISFIAT